MKYHVMPKNAVGETAVITERQGVPTDMTDVITVDLPDNNGWLTIISKGKEYPAHKVALAVAMGQISLTDVKGGRGI